VVTSIWKWEFASGAARHYVYGALQPYKRRSEIPFALERLQIGRKWMFINQIGCDRGLLQIPLRQLLFVNGAKPQCRCKAF